MLIPHMDILSMMLLKREMQPVLSIITGKGDNTEIISVLHADASPALGDRDRNIPYYWDVDPSRNFSRN
jgi:hypothetical protein